MNQQAGLAGVVAMVRAANFAANPETLQSNAFQSATTEPGATARAISEQQQLADALQRAGVDVLWLEPPQGSVSPDGVFPNNWFSTHEDGRIALYPMEAPSRRSERNALLPRALEKAGFVAGEIVDFAPHENVGKYLEGTGSLVLDRVNRVAYAAVSTRTHFKLAQQWAKQFGYELHAFHAADPAGRPVYHTNVVMSLGAGLAILCLESIADAAERASIRSSLASGGNTVLEISWSQVCKFAGNQLFLRGRDGPVVALSAAAESSLSSAQLDVIDDHAQRIAVDIATIERHGGGSVRCMLAEIFLPRHP